MSIDTSVLSISDAFGGEQIQHRHGPNTFVAGERIRLAGASHVDGAAQVVVEEPDGSTRTLGDVDAGLAWTADAPGRYTVRTADGDWIGGYSVVSADGIDVPEVSGDGPGHDEFVNVDTSRDVDPSNYGMIVIADTPSGIALSPSAVREGITADEDGTEVNLSDGTTVTVYPREDADETIRGTETGNPIDSPVGSGGVEGGVGGDSSSDGLLGGAVAVVLLLVAGAAALLGGGD